MGRVYRHTNGKLYERLGEGHMDCPSEHVFEDLSHYDVMPGEGTSLLFRPAGTAAEGLKPAQATLQIGKRTKVNGPMTMYRSADGKLWVRPTAEFEDGRFIELENDLKTPKNAAAAAVEAEAKPDVRDLGAGMGTAEDFKDVERFSPGGTAA
jgi:hypothetical protein